MALQITLVKTPGKVSVSKTTHTFSEKGGTLGRGESNTWVLPDPDKFLSSCHCEILFEANRYFIVDLSTNGTFVNSSPEPLGKGTRVPLTEGDFFELGDYRFSATLVAGQSFAGSSPFGGVQSPANVASLDDIFGASASTGSSFADPFSSSGSLAADFSLSPDIENTDPLLALDRARRAPESEMFGNQGLFGQESDPLVGELFSSSSEIDFSPGMDQSMSWPESKQESLIPDDWEEDLFGSGSSPLAPPFGIPDERPPVAPVNRDPVSPPPQPKIPRPERPQMPPVAPAVQVAAKLPPVEPAFPQALANNPQPVAGRPVSGPAPGADHRLIAAMGLDASRLTNEQINEISDMAGELMREIVDGMMQVLRSRTSIKNEFRMNVTTIQPSENNPLKFSVGVDEALENMFIKKSNAYKRPVEAFREGFQEIGEHQVAMIAGIRHGFERMMERFNPEILEKNFNKQGKGGVIPGMQKAKYWNTYGEYYKGFVDNMESSFQHLFGSDFVHAYEDQLRKLAAARKRNK